MSHNGHMPLQTALSLKAIHYNIARNNILHTHWKSNKIIFFFLNLFIRNTALALTVKNDLRQQTSLCRRVCNARGNGLKFRRLTCLHQRWRENSYSRRSTHFTKNYGILQKLIIEKFWNKLDFTYFWKMNYGALSFNIWNS